MRDHENMNSITINTNTDLDDIYTVDVSNDSSGITLNLDDYTTDTINLDNISWDLGNKIDPDRVERMCKHYPALQKAWDNFHAIYKMVDQDYKGNFEDDDIPF